MGDSGIDVALVSADIGGLNTEFRADETTLLFDNGLGSGLLSVGDIADEAKSRRVRARSDRAELGGEGIGVSAIDVALVSADTGGLKTESGSGEEASLSVDSGWLNLKLPLLLSEIGAEIGELTSSGTCCSTRGSSSGEVALLRVDSG